MLLIHDQALRLDLIQTLNQKPPLFAPGAEWIGVLAAKEGGA